MYDTFDYETIQAIIELTELRVIVCSEAEKDKVLAAAKGTSVQVVAVFAVGGGGWRWDGGRHSGNDGARGGDAV